MESSEKGEREQVPRQEPRTPFGSSEASLQRGISM